MAEMNEAGVKYLESRVRRMPDLVESSRRKFTAILREAKRYGMADLVNEAWEKTLHEAQADASVKGGSVGFGDGKR